MRHDVSDFAEFRFTESDFRIIADLAHRESGIFLPGAKLQFVYSRLVKRVRELRLASFKEYCNLLQGEGGQAELPILISALTTNVTRFQREAHHTDHLREKVLPKLVERAKRGDRIRIWSAACSTGEEAYEIAFQFLDICPNAASLDVKILASDIDPYSLSIAKVGEYPSTALAPLPKGLVRRFFLPAGGVSERLAVVDGPRQLLTFRPLNLVRDWPVKGPFDAVFCRNVAIYFDLPTQESLWQRFANIIAVGGVLYIGHSERILGPAAELFKSEGVTTFKRRAPGKAPPTAALLASKGSRSCH